MQALPRILAAMALALAPASVAWADPSPAGHDHAGHDHAVEVAYGRPGDPAKGGRVVQVVMKETDSGMAFAPERIEVAKGEQVQFVLRNGGELDHELVIGTVEANRVHAEAMASHPNMAREDPNAKRLGPKTSGVLRWQFTQAGTFEYACLIPGHREAGMVGTVVVK
ncbi:cupredoxin domain-containing protein [Microvirga yunnanensis]|uniref:cupredoxin domain-containing protein n=1 Tax=Microvirga yunnanensis TaxID=2953740 RepID=UPI0021C6F8FD|nr:cupredoxin family protein [Microvirga sp. HBU65207]